jgi:glutathione S-transferase
MLAKFGTSDRFRTLEWTNFVATEIHKNFSPLFGTEKMFKSTETQNDVKNFYKNVLTDKFNFLAEKLGQNNYLTGNDFTIADAYLFTCLTWTKYVGIDMTLWSNLNTYMKRVSERPAVIKAMKEEGLIK